ISDSGCVPRAPGDGRGVRRKNYSCAETVSWKDQPDTSRRKRCLPEIAKAVYGDAVPFIDRGKEISAAGVDDHGGNFGWRDQGDAAPAVQDGRSAIPSGVGVDRVRQASAAKFPVSVANSHLCSKQPLYLIAR